MANVQNVDLNRASAEEIVSANIPQVNEEHARELVQYREENGMFESWDELQDVPGFDQSIIDALQEAGVTMGNEAGKEDSE
jgi:competence ComEA-like helix-hairpin-helix protein